MASGGGFGRSWNRECDKYFDYSCTRCSAEGKNVEASNFCVECKEYFCVKCVKYYHKFGKTKTHTILDQAGIKTRGPQQATSQPTEKCQLHHGNILDTFCVQHDAVCCRTCVSLFHKSCEDMEYLPTAADELQVKHQMFQKQINDDIKNLEEMLTPMETNPNIEDYIKTQNSVGDFQEVQEVEQVYSASLYGEFDMKVSKDKSECDIRGSCVMEDGTILVADCTNKRLKRLSRSYQVRDYCDLSDTPWAVCATGPQEVAVTLFNERKIQFVSVGDKMKPTRSFRVQGDYTDCWGVAYSNNQLFVACNNPAAVVVYNMSGKLLNTIQQDMITEPRHITASTDQTKLYIADTNNGLITLGIHGDIQSQFTDPDLTWACEVCVGNNDEMFVCGWFSHNIIQIGRDGSKLGVVLGEADGIKEPQSLYWDRTNSRLIVTMGNTNHIKVFNMKL